MFLKSSGIGTGIVSGFDSPGRRRTRKEPAGVLRGTEEVSEHPNSLIDDVLVLSPRI